MLVVSVTGVTDPTQRAMIPVDVSELNLTDHDWVFVQEEYLQMILFVPHGDVQWKCVFDFLKLPTTTNNNFDVRFFKWALENKIIVTTQLCTLQWYLKHTQQIGVVAVVNSKQCLQCQTRNPKNSYCGMRCGHIFCSNCVVKMVKENTLGCPQCLQRFDNYAFYYTTWCNFMEHFYTTEIY